jgi:hypothetical protein
VPFVTPNTILPSTDEVGMKPVGLIMSKREPYAVENYYNPYGTMETKLGTNLGT